MLMLEDGVKAVFDKDSYRVLIANIRRYGRHALWFDGDKIKVVRSSTGRNRDPVDWIATYGAKDAPTYERVLNDITFAADQYEQQLKASIS